MNADVAGAAHEVLHHGAVQQLEQLRAFGLAGDDVGDVVVAGVGDDVVGDAPAGGRHRHGLPAEAVREAQRVGDAIALDIGELQTSTPVDRQCDPWRAEPVREALGVAHQAGAARVLADADDDALASGPRPRDGVGLHVVEKLVVDALGGAAQCEFP